MTKLLVNATVVIMFQYIPASNQHAVHLNFTQYYMSIVSQLKKQQQQHTLAISTLLKMPLKLSRVQTFQPGYLAGRFYSSSIKKALFCRSELTCRVDGLQAGWGRQSLPNLASAWETIQEGDKKDPVLQVAHQSGPFRFSDSCSYLASLINLSLKMMIIAPSSPGCCGIKFIT